MNEDELRALSRGDLLAVRLKDAILNGELKPGEPLVERQIADRYGMSKTPVREALRSLASGRLVVARGYKAVVVQPLTAEVIEDVFQLRLRLEPWAAELAVERGVSGWLEDLKLIQHRVEEYRTRGDLAASSKEARAFHRLIYANSGNALLVETLDGLQDLMAFISVNLWKRRSVWGDESSEHHEIMQALEVEDKATIHTCMSRHLIESQRRVRLLLTGQDSPELGKTEDLAI